MLSLINPKPPNASKTPPSCPQKTPRKRAFSGMVSIRSSSDYSPFGVQLENRNFLKSGLAEDYRMGFQGQEEDDEVKGEDNSMNYKFRMHDPRLGRFFAVDPLTRKYPYYTPYSFSGNEVIHLIELEGLEPASKALNDGNSCINVTKTRSQLSTVGDEMAPIRVKDIVEPIGLLCTGAGYICGLIPTPQTQAASKFLVPVGEVISVSCAAVEISERLQNDDLDGAVLVGTIELVSFATGGIIQNAYDVGKISNTDRIVLNSLVETNSEVVSELIPDKSKVKNTSNVNSSNSIKLNIGPMGVAVQNEIKKTDQKTSNKPSSKKAITIMSTNPIENFENSMKVLKSNL